MRELRVEVIGDRRVCLVADQHSYYAVTLEVRGPLGLWEDISLAADAGLGLPEAQVRFRRRVAEQQARALGLGNL